jgi:hypothetical protein
MANLELRENDIIVPQTDSATPQQVHFHRIRQIA